MYEVLMTHEELIKQNDNIYLEKIYELIEKSNMRPVKRRDVLDILHYSRRVGKRLIKKFQLEKLIGTFDKYIYLTEKGMERVIPFHEWLKEIRLNYGKIMMERSIKELDPVRKLEIININESESNK